MDELMDGWKEEGREVLGLDVVPQTPDKDLVLPQASVIFNSSQERNIK